MTIERDQECRRLGTDISNFWAERNELNAKIRRLEVQSRNIEERIFDIKQAIRHIDVAEHSARSLGGRGGIGGAVAGEVTAQAIRLAMQRDALEAELRQKTSELSRLKQPIEQAKRRLASVEHILRELRSGFENLKCPGSRIPR